MFDGTSSKISGFVSVYKLYLRMKIRGIMVEKQIQWVSLYIQEELVDVWKKNTLKDLKGGLLEYKNMKEFLVYIKKEFKGEDKEGVKVVELKRLDQGEKIMEEFVQEFRRTVRNSRYKGRPLVEEFKRGMNEIVY